MSATVTAAESGKKPASSVRFDSKALNGLRGFAAFHICVFHVLHYSTLSIGIYAQVHMPLFFLLSGFSCTLGYGRKKYKRTTQCCGPCGTTTGCECEKCKSAEEEIFDSWGFYYGRMTRLLPVYYATYLFALILSPLGHNHDHGKVQDQVWGSFLALYGVQTWVLKFGFGPVGPSWTVSTLFFFYLLFPRLLVFAQRQCNRKLTIYMALAFYFELVLGMGILFGMGEGESYWVATAWPPTRLPVFFMGICAGVICTRIQSGDANALESFGRKNDNCFLSFWEDNHFPWPFCQGQSEKKKETDPTKYQRSWRRRVDVNTGYYIGLLVIFSILNIVYKYPLREAKGPEAEVFRDSWPGAIMQLTACYTQLMVTVGLCMDGGRSLTARFFNTRVMQYLGRISMALYLVHENMVFWINLCYYGPIGHNDHKPEGMKLPVWGIPIAIILSLAFATMLTIFLEEPARKRLKPLYRPEHSKKLCILGTVWLILGVIFVIVGTIVFTGGFVLAEEKIEINEQTFYFQKMLTGHGTSFKHAQEICKSKGFALFQPRDATINYMVYEKAKDQYGTYWLGISRDNPETMIFKYGSDDMEITWQNWNPGEPNNWQNGYENCVAANFEIWGYECREKWIDINCGESAGVICQEQAVIDVAKDINVMHGGKKFVIKPSKSGNLSEANEICEADGMMLFEPRDNDTFSAVHEKAREAGQDLIWLNIGRDSPDEKFKYLSDGTELVWSMMSEDQGPELCVMAQTVNSYDEETEEKGWKDVWNAFRCIRFGQVICQEKP